MKKSYYFKIIYNEENINLLNNNSYIINNKMLEYMINFYQQIIY